MTIDGYTIVRENLKKFSRRRRRAIDYGFTIVELIIVIVVIAILATIAIVSFNGVQNKAKDVGVNSNLRDIADIAELYKASNRYYPGKGGGPGLFMRSLVSASSSYGKYNFANSSYGSFLSSPKTNLLVVIYFDVPGNVTNYCIGVVSQSGQAYWVTSTTGIPVKGPYGTPIDSITVNDILTQCSSMLGSDVTPASSLYAGYDVTDPNQSWM